MIQLCQMLFIDVPFECNGDQPVCDAIYNST